jgi:thioesterase domain-containing protein
MVAFEMAQQLRRLGEEVALVICFNGYSPTYARSRAGMELAPAPLVPGVDSSEKVHVPWQPNKLAYVWKRTSQEVGRRWRNFSRQLRNLPQRARALPRKIYSRLGLAIPEFMRNEFFLDNSAQAELRYYPPPYPGSMILFSGENYYGDPLAGWGALVQGRIELYTYRQKRGARNLLRPPCVQAVAEKLNQVLRETAQAAGAPPRQKYHANGNVTHELLAGPHGFAHRPQTATSADLAS